MAGWVGGLAEWVDGETMYLSVAFTWKINEAFSRAQFARACGLQVKCGGPALFPPSMRRIMEPVAECPPLKSEGALRDSVSRHNPHATFASRGCPEDCVFCIVPRMQGQTFTLIPDFPVRPILCDNNLSALTPEYQDHIIGRYKAEGVPLLDANSGFEPKTFTDDVFHRWKEINRGPWRFAFDEEKEREQAVRVMQMLKAEPQKKKRVYVLIGNEPYETCMDRVYTVIGMGCEPHVQPVMKLNALERRPDVRFDWTEQKLKDVARWANGFVWKRCRFDEYDRHRKNAPVEQYDEQQGLFV